MSRSTTTHACYLCNKLGKAAHAAAAADGDLRVFGTWDFKWPQNHEIRVAFQRLRDDPNDELLKKYLARFAEAASTWRDPESRIRFSFEQQRFLPPPSLPWAVSDLSHERAPLAYDVLVSFATLPVFIPSTERRPETVQVETQSSELGSYATRVDYGVPTLFVGPIGGEEPERYLADDWFRATVVHEFGHALGLAHTHQNPLYRRKLTQPPQIRPDGLSELRRLTTWSRFPKDQVAEELSSEWPHVAFSGSSVPFSDWIEPPEEDGKSLDKLSAMAHFGWGLLIGENDEQVVPLVAPTEWDFKQLRALYAPPEASTVSEAAE